MKRMVILLAGIAALGITAYVGSQLRADPQYQGQVQQATATAPGAQMRTRVAVINLMQVIKKYEKFLEFEKATKNYMEQVRAEFERKKASGVEMEKRLTEMPADDPQRDAMQQKLKDVKREIQDLDEGAKKKILKYQDDSLVQIYREIQDAVQRYAVANDIEMVVHYNDGTTEAEKFHPMSVSRKMQTIGCMPIYVNPGMDISDIIAANLNARLHSQPASGQR